LRYHSYNENNNPGQRIQKSFNFDEDMHEMGEEGTYTNEPPEDDDE
jgi:hypothetical protein